MIWDMVGPYRIKHSPEKMGVKPASDDVLEMEYRDMINRRTSLYPLRNQISFLSYVAAQVASDTLIAFDPRYAAMDEQSVLSFKELSINIGAAVTDAVISHLLEQGLIHLGGHQ